MLVAFGGLVVTSQLKEIASFYRVDKTIIAWGLSAAILAIHWREQRLGSYNGSRFWGQKGNAGLKGNCLYEPI